MSTDTIPRRRITFERLLVATEAALANTLRYLATALQPIA